jgi:serine/threonine protein kinase
MENLGIDLFTCIDKQEYLNLLAKIPDIVPIILTQFYKLIHQVDQLRDHKLCHCDIRLENIMIDVDTCTLTLIDFDQLGTFDRTITNLQDVASYNFYIKRDFSTAWPIEWVVICNSFSEKPLSHDDLITLYMTNEILILYGIVYGIETSKVKESLTHLLRKTLIDITDRVLDVIQIIRTHKISSNNAAPLIYIMSRFDTFGLGLGFSYFYVI